MTSDVKAETITFTTKRTVSVPTKNKLLTKKRVRNMLKKLHPGDNRQHGSLALTSP